MSKILVIAAHPDDEILGVGATIAKRVSNGDTAYALILAEGQTSRWDSREKAKMVAVEELHQDTYEAASIIGYREVFWGNMPDNRMDSCDMLDIVKCIERHLEKLKPDTLYTHHGGDLNIDHQLTTKAVITASRPIGDYPVRQIYAFPTVSSTEWNFGNKEQTFSPNVFEDIMGFLQVKCEAMGKYRSELCEFPHPRSLEMLRTAAAYWGSTVGIPQAEAFELIRLVR